VVGVQAVMRTSASGGTPAPCPSTCLGADLRETLRVVPAMPGTLIPLLAATAKAAGRTFRLLPSNADTLPRWHGCCLPPRWPGLPLTTTGITAIYYR
jgi:hypothetical protein